jgi:hypothetical protein
MEIKQEDSTSYFVESGDKRYLVYLFKGRWTCDCPGFYHYGTNNPNFQCKHIREVLKKIENEGR